MITHFSISRRMMCCDLFDRFGFHLQYLWPTTWLHILPHMRLSLFSMGAPPYTDRELQIGWLTFMVSVRLYIKGGIA